MNEIKVLMGQYKIGQGKRTDILTCKNLHITAKKTRDVALEILGMSGYQFTKL